MSEQTAVEIYMGKAFAGLIADMRPREIDSKIWEGADGIFGIFVTRGTGDGQVILPSDVGDQMIGPVIAHQNIELDRGGVLMKKNDKTYDLLRKLDGCQPLYVDCVGVLYANARIGEYGSNLIVSRNLKADPDRENQGL